MAIGRRIKEIRERRGISQQALADKIGVSKQTMYKYENDIITNIPSPNVEAIARALNCDPAELMGWDTENRYYLDDDARDYAQFLFDNPEYKVLFDASRKVRPEDIDFVRQMIDRMNGDTDD